METHFHQTSQKMSQKAEFEVVYFYSHACAKSLRTKNAISKILNKDYKQFNIKLRHVNYDKEKEICRKYKVTGTPRFVFLINRKPIARYCGELTFREFEAVLMNLLVFQ